MAKIDCFEMDEKKYTKGCPTRKRDDLKRKIPPCEISTSNLDLWESLASKEFFAVVRHKKTKIFYLIKSWPKKRCNGIQYNSIMTGSGPMDTYNTSWKGAK
jgi:hypothetical protein